jgi:translation initiation factor 4G
MNNSICYSINFIKQLQNSELSKIIPDNTFLNRAHKIIKTENTNIIDDKYIHKTFTGILNKLTFENFKVLLEKIKLLKINTEESLIIIIDLIFEKSILEPKFSKVYACICNELLYLKVFSEQSNNYITFKRLLIDRCRMHFYNSLPEEINISRKNLNECIDTKKKELKNLLREKNIDIKFKYIGNINFIGELYKINILSIDIMIRCISYLIKDESNEDKLEFLCKLLIIIGKDMENNNNYILNDIFDKLQNIIYHVPKKPSNRIKFMIQDLIDFRNRKWIKKI